MKGEEKLWSILNDKLDTLRASGRLPEAIRVAETLLELAKRTFGDDDNALALSYEKLGQLLDQSGDHVKAKPYLLKAHGVLEKAKPPDQRLLYRSARRLAFLSDNLGQQEEATVIMRRRSLPARTSMICLTRIWERCLTTSH